MKLPLQKGEGADAERGGGRNRFEVLLTLEFEALAT